MRPWSAGASIPDSQREGCRAVPRITLRIPDNDRSPGDFIMPSRLALACAAALLAAGCASTPPTAADAIARASKAMGADQLQSLRYAGDGEGFTFGQAYLPNGPWPKVAYHAVVRTIDYQAGAMRDEVTLSRAEPRGGGGYPLSGQQRNDQFVSGELAWNVAGGNVAPGSRFVADRVHQLWITPHGVLKAAQRHNATLAAGEGGAQRLSFTQPGRLRATVTLDGQGMVTQVDSTYPDPVLGDTAVRTTYSDYKDFAGIKFPTRVRQSSGGHPVLDLAIKEVQPNAPVAALAVPDAARNTAERVLAEKVADGVWHLAGGSHNSVLVEMNDHLVLVETPLNDARTQAVIDHVKTLVPGKPIRYAVNSHAHFDHAGGVRAAVAEGATVVTMAGNVPYFQSALAVPNALRPDRLLQSGKPARLQGVQGDRGQLSDGTRTIELHKISGGPHSDTMLMAWLPKERLLIQADAYTPLPPNTPPPATPNANNVNLIENIERLKLPVDRILPLHGRVVPLAELYTTAGRQPPAR
jgi:glyoxylase-like metal-dependent hydrolase (beta-lactamase superfamily II)